MKYVFHNDSAIPGEKSFANDHLRLRSEAFNA